MHQNHRANWAHDQHTGRPHHRDPRHGPGNLPSPLRELFGRRSGRPSVRRGEIRPLILNTLLEHPMHGYEVIQALESSSGGRWRPSAGSVYPTLQLLADEGLVTSSEVDGRRTYTLTQDGRKAAESAPAKHPSWDDEDLRDGDLRHAALQLARAAIQVQAVGSARARRESGKILADTRRQLYRILADDEAVDEDGEGRDTAVTGDQA